MSDDEQPLRGGRTTEGVVSVGNTVRRPVQSDHRPVHDLLMHLKQKRFDAAPHFLGIDAEGREVLSFLPGDVPDELGRYDDRQLSAAALLLRRFHDATSDFGPVTAIGAEVVCHNDWAPTNTVFRDGLPCALIDFDTLAPGSRLWDLGYSAFTWLDLGNDDYTGPEQVRRLDVFARGYDLPGVSAGAIAAHAVARQTALSVSADMQGNAALRDWAAQAARWTILNVTERLLPTGYNLATVAAPMG